MCINGVLPGQEEIIGIFKNSKISRDMDQNLLRCNQKMNPDRKSAEVHFILFNKQEFPEKTD